MMIEKLLEKMKSINPWHFVWISIVFSEVITCVLSVLQGRVWWGGVSRQTLVIGAVDSLVAPLVVATIVIFFVKRAAELKKLNEQLEETNRKLQELDNLKTDFVTTVSHELRTPLSTVKAFVELLMMKPDMPEMRKRKLIASINGETDRLSRLISDLLDVARIESGSIQWRMERLFIEDIIESRVAVMAPLFENKALSITTAFSAPRVALLGDRDRLAQVLTNILSNAVKFTKPGGAIRIAVRRELMHVAVEISDTGVGIPAAHLKAIFEKFRRLNGGSGAESDGNGLGLSIAKQVIEHHGGTIWATSDGRGSTFTFTLPVSQA